MSSLSHDMRVMLYFNFSVISHSKKMVNIEIHGRKSNLTICFSYSHVKFWKNNKVIDKILKGFQVYINLKDSLKL